MTLPNPDDRGFTLMEVLVAMTLLSMILLTLFASFRAFSDSAEGVRQTIRDQEAGLPGFRVMICDLEQVFVLPYPRYRPREFNQDPDPYRMEGHEVSLEGQSVARLSFASLNRFPVGALPGISRITYYVHSRDGRLDLLRADRSWPFDQDLAPCSDPVLIQGISSFSLTYENDGEDDGKGENKTWDSDHKDFRFTFPDRIRLRVTLGGKGRETTLETMVTIPVSREAVQ